MTKYNARYKPFINDKNKISPLKMERNRFYLVKEYMYVDGDNKKYSDLDAPIIYTLFVSKANDIVHCVKVSNIMPGLVKKFFGKFINEKTEKLEMKGKSSAIYENFVKKVPIVTNNAYRTYKLSGLQRVLALSMDVEALVPKSKLLKKIDSKLKIQPKEKIQPKPKVQPKSSIKPKSKK
jgi:hypothetical protein